ncbi:MAG: GNAT family N-acetyltransferase [Rhizobiaceae bacterium]|nr:GNAT family N-acetyltransferase [Rhizobiaceae bacterium]
MSTVDVRVMSPADVETLVGWAGGEGWNPGKSDGAMFRSADPDGFIGTYVGGELAAGIAAIAYGESYGFIGLYITRADLRGRGYGKRLWNAGIGRLSGRTIGLDAVEAQVENYRASAFQEVYRTLRFAGTFQLRDRPAQVQLENCNSSDFAELASFDLEAFGADRETFLRKWISRPHHSIAALSEGSIVGYGTVRQCLEGYKIGPLFACRPAIAAEIFFALCKATDGCVYIDVPEYQSEFIDLLGAHGLRSIFQTTRMYLGGLFAPNSRVFGVTTLELG